MSAISRDTYIKNAVFRALCYAEVFRSALSLDNLKTFCIGDKKISSRAIKHFIQSSKKLTQYKNFLAFSDKKTLCNKSAKAFITQQHKMYEAEAAARHISKIPTVLGVFVTGGVAVGNCEEHDDIDFMIVCKKNSLWITRMLVIVIAKGFGKYRAHTSAQLKNQWCLNLWLDTEALSVPSAYQNVYTAHEVVQAVSVFDRANIADEFIAINSWVKQFLPNVVLPRVTIRKHFSPIWLDLLNTAAFYIQNLYMSSRKTRERVSLHAAFFHPRDTAGYVMAHYEKLLKKRGIPLE